MTRAFTSNAVHVTTHARRMPHTSRASALRGRLMQPQAIRITAIATFLLVAAVAQRPAAAHPTYEAYACQRASDLFGIVAEITWGIAPADVQDWWTATGCDTTPVSLPNQAWCQRASDAYLISASNSEWGFAPVEIRGEWQARGCDTNPTQTLSECQRYSNQLAIDAGNTFGFAPSAVQNRWILLGCNTATRVYEAYACQRASDLFGISARTNWGFAPANVQTWWTSTGCDMVPEVISNGEWCQRASDGYGIVAERSWGYAPAEIQSQWTARQCFVDPNQSLSECQRYSNELGIAHGITFGFASIAIQARWAALGCHTLP